MNWWYSSALRLCIPCSGIYIPIVFSVLGKIIRSVTMLISLTLHLCCCVAPDWRACLIPTPYDYVCLDVDDDNSTTITFTTVLATQNLLALLHTTTCQNLGEIDATPNESNGPESNRPRASVTLTKFV